LEGSLAAHAAFVLSLSKDAPRVPASPWFDKLTTRLAVWQLGTLSAARARA
jgi:hypothetical protein